MVLTVVIFTCSHLRLMEMSAVLQPFGRKPKYWRNQKSDLMMALFTKIHANWKQECIRLLERSFSQNHRCELCGDGN